MHKLNWALIATVVSAICAVVSVFSVISIQCISAKEEKFFRRPIIGLMNTVVTAKEVANGDIHIGHLLTFKNFGHTIAEGAKLRIFSTLMTKPEKLEKKIDDTLVNDILPETTFSREMGYTLLTRNSSLNTTKMYTVIILVIDYFDPINQKNERTIIWMKYEIGEKSLFHMSTKERDVFKPKLIKLIREDRG